METSRELTPAFRIFGGDSLINDPAGATKFAARDRSLPPGLAVAAESLVADRLADLVEDVIISRVGLIGGIDEGELGVMGSPRPEDCPKFFFGRIELCHASPQVVGSPGGPDFHFFKLGRGQDLPKQALHFFVVLQGSKVGG